MISYGTIKYILICILIPKAYKILSDLIISFYHSGLLNNGMSQDSPNILLKFEKILESINYRFFSIIID
jgi:hypothetical protein